MISLGTPEKVEDAWHATLSAEPDICWKVLWWTNLDKSDGVRSSFKGRGLIMRNASMPEADLRSRLELAAKETNEDWLACDASGKRQESLTLRKKSKMVLATLSGVTLVAGVIAVALLSAPFDAGHNPVSLAALAITAGTLGSAVAALRSTLDRRAAGWEFEDGTKFPAPEPAAKFSDRMVPYLLLRPLLGFAMGLVIFAGLAGGQLFTQNGGPSPAQVLFFALLAGLFAKTLWEKLLDLFKTLVGADKKPE